MQELEILNKKKIKEIGSILEKQWGAKTDIENYIVFLSPKNKLFIATKEISKINLEDLRVDAIGLYFGELVDGKLRLSIEGSQIIGPDAQKFVLELDEINSQKWLSGEDFEIQEHLEEGFYIIKNHVGDFCGCGKVIGKKLYNYVPKERRVTTI
jgi:NOL1/NOP2/fmu family ribosome biogenesis protein